MAGNKNSGNRTGRPSRYMQVQKGNLLDICTEWLIENFNTFDKETKLKVALQIAPKGITQKVETKVEASIKVTHETVEERLNCLSSHN